MIGTKRQGPPRDSLRKLLLTVLYVGLVYLIIFSSRERFPLPQKIKANLPVEAKGITEAPGNLAAAKLAESLNSRLYIPFLTGGSSSVPPEPCNYGPHAVPGLLQAEDFNCGGEGVAFNEEQSSGPGSEIYRSDVGPEGPDLEATSDTGGGYNVGWTHDNEWLQYSVQISAAGSYDIRLRVASAVSGGRFVIKLDGVDLIGEQTVPKTGGWQNWIDITMSDVTLPGGDHTLQLTFTGMAGNDIGNINYINIVPAGTSPTPSPPPPPTVTPPAGSKHTYYISPSGGNDNNSGLTPAEAWATFDRALNGSLPSNQLEPGDTLIIKDGVYYQSIRPGYGVGGEPGNPITIRAQNDGKAIIDGQGVRTPVYLGDQGYFIIEGIIAQNSPFDVYHILTDGNILRRVSAYNADNDYNSSVYSIQGVNNLLEDCVASGTGRKMILLFAGEYNTVRRCFADWRQFDGREWNQCWPWGDGIEIYNSDYSIVENSIAYSRASELGIGINAQGDAIGNKILGSMAILTGMKEDGTPMVWNPPRPQPSIDECVYDPIHQPRRGFSLYESGSPAIDNLFQDIFAWGSAGRGLEYQQGVAHPDTRNNRVNRATIYNNGLNNPEIFGGIGTDAIQSSISKFDSVDNSYIETIYTGSGYTSQYGEGARLTHRYVDGVLTDEPLWPWPMEARIQAELGYSVTDIMTDILSKVP